MVHLQRTALYRDRKYGFGMSDGVPTIRRHIKKRTQFTKKKKKKKELIMKSNFTWRSFALSSEREDFRPEIKTKRRETREKKKTERKKERKNRKLRRKARQA